MITRPPSVHVIILKAETVSRLPPLTACQIPLPISGPVWLALFPRTSGKGTGRLGFSVLLNSADIPHLSAWCDHVTNPGQLSRRVELAAGAGSVDSVGPSSDMEFQLSY